VKFLAFAFFDALAQAQSFSSGAKIDARIEEAIGAGLIPGAVVTIGHNGKVVYSKVYGSKSLVPAPSPMTEDTIFDAASLTKVIATTSAVMKLFEEGRIGTNDPVTKYLPEFQGGNSNITIRDLMTHFSGLRPDLDLKPAWSGYQTGIHKALIDRPNHLPGTRFVYSDINFILLGEIVHRLSGRMLDAYVQEEVFRPLGMTESRFNPPPEWRARIAPTELERSEPWLGVVHDETSRFMGGVAGHAGLFTTAHDLGLFAEMMLNLGELNGTRVFSAQTIRKFTAPNSPARQSILRGLGWDIDSPYSANRGELFPVGSYGHTGFTGTSIWLDPGSHSYVILLTNSVHPTRGKNITPLRRAVATIAAAELLASTPSAGAPVDARPNYADGGEGRRALNRNTAVQTGLDVMAAQKFAPFAGKRVGLITNHTGLSRDGRRNLDLMLESGVKVTAVFTPEHGLEGKFDQDTIADTNDPATGVHVYSLYQPNRRKLPVELLKDVDVLVFDIQDVGARYYTYSCTLLYALETAATRKIPFFVLDRPNPITGLHPEGPMLDSGLTSFVGCYNVPVRHGLTLGELAAMANAESKWNVPLTVIPVKQWQRADWFDSGSLVWTDLSPNMRSLNAAILYPGVAWLEASSNVSVGRGTDAPFEQIGADWMRGQELASYLNVRFLPGVRVYPTRFLPTSSNFSGKTIEGIRFVLTDRDQFSASRLGVELCSAIEKLFPGKIDWETNRWLLGNRELINALKSGTDPRQLSETIDARINEYLVRRTPYLLYR
jgi:uncharacterized protein YbbC (DUF1343 family)/CubicO group peptidase (beta-lactamase class C family)